MEWDSILHVPRQKEGGIKTCVLTELVVFDTGTLLSLEPEFSRR